MERQNVTSHNYRTVMWQTFYVFYLFLSRIRYKVLAFSLFVFIPRFLNRGYIGQLNEEEILAMPGFRKHLFTKLVHKYRASKVILYFHFSRSENSLEKV